jgi:hypothetical protein
MRSPAPLAAALILLAGALPVLAAPRSHGASRRNAGPPDAGASDAGTNDAGAGDAGDAGADDAGTNDAGPADDAGAAAGSVVGACVEHVPPGVTRPMMTEELPQRGLSGYAVELRLVIAHGKGETVLPEGFHLRTDGEALKALEKAGFVIPDAEGGVAPKIVVSPGSVAVTTITIPVVPLPPKPGRSMLELPPLPIAISRASNEYITLCTAPHQILIDDPIANELDPKVKPNPPGRKQLEDWPLARILAVAVPLGGALLLAGALLSRWWSRRPKVERARPKVPPWTTALEELERIRRSSLLEDGKRGEYFDRVSDALRRYLGGRYGFDTLPEGYVGLETTTGEMLALLKRVRPPIVELPRIKDFLDDCDLVKFARFTPSNEQCLDSLARCEAIVRRTIPVMQIPTAPGSPEASS